MTAFATGREDVASVQAGATPDEQETLARLDAFGIEIAAMRREAIAGRRQLGIEDEWLEDEEAYVGVDDANRAEFHSTWRQMKPTPSGQWSTRESKTRNASTVRSTALVNITRPYVDAAVARVSDMLLPNDDRCWELEPTPIPDLVLDAEEDAMIVLDPATGWAEPQKDVVAAMRAVAEERAEKAETQIDDWFAECGWKMETRTIIEDAGRIGTGVLKGPVPQRKRMIAWTFPNGIPTKQIKYKTQPASVAVDAWNCFPDPGCGQDIQDGAYFFERDRISPKRLLGLRGGPGYITAQIEACLREGPISPEADWTPSLQVERSQFNARSMFELWYCHATVARADLEAAGLDTSMLPDGEERFFAVVEMVNHRVIKASLSPLEDGTFPYDFFTWQKRPGMPWGMGVARQIRVPQRMLTAAIRNLMDNAALSAGPQIVVDVTKIRPVDGDYTLRPRKEWVAVEGAEDVDVREAFIIVSIETRQAELMNIIEFALRMAEESTGLPMILQGQLGEKQISTLGQQQMLQNNATAVLRRLAKVFDDYVTVPHVTRYYHWMMEYGDDDKAKGDYNAVGRGSSTLVERDIQNQGIALILQLSATSPAYGVDPAKAMEEYVRSQHLDPKRFEYDEEQKATMAQQPPDPKLQAAEVSAQTAREKMAHESDENDKAQRADMTGKLLEINNKTALFNAEQALKEKMGSGV